MPKTETPGTGVFLPLSFPAPAPSDDPAQQGQTSVAQQSKPAGPHHKAAVGRSHTFSAGAQGSKSQGTAPDSNQQGAASQHSHHTHGAAHRYHSFSYFSPREQPPQQQWADTTARAPAAGLQLWPPTSTGTGWAAGPNTPQVQPRVMAEGSPSSGSSNSRKAWAIDLPNCSSVLAAATSGAYSSACLPLEVSPTATAAAGGGGGSTMLGMAGSSICSSSYCDAPRGSWSSSGCSSGRSSTDARGGASATSAAYHSAFYHSSQLQPAGAPAAAGPSCSTAAPAVPYHRLLPVQPGEEQHHSCHSLSLGFDPAASHSGLLAQQLQPSMFGATDLVTAGSLTTSSSDLSLPLMLAHDSARLQLLQQLQQAPSALDLEEQINKELLWLLELRQRLTQNSPSASAAKAAAAAGRAAAGSTSDSCVPASAAHYQQVMMPMRGGHPHQPACWFDDSAGRIHSRAPAACAAGFSNGSSATLQTAVGAGPAAVVLQRAHSGGLGSRLPSGSLGLPRAGSSSSNSLGSCSTGTSNRGASNGEQPTVTADMAPADVAVVVQTKLQQLQMIQELQGDLEAELLQLLPM